MLVDFYLKEIVTQQQGGQSTEALYMQSAS